MSNRLLIGCEESQAVCVEMRKRGVDAYSCDVIDCSGPLKQYHIKADVLDVIRSGDFKNGIFFPPCTHLATSGARHFPEKIKDGRQQQAIDFFMAIACCGMNRMCIENPVGIMSTNYRKPDQIINPYYFGDNVPKKTCLWLKNLPPLFYSYKRDLFTDKTVVEPEYFIYRSKSSPKGFKRYSIFGTMSSTKTNNVAAIRSKTFPGVAMAMADQWHTFFK